MTAADPHAAPAPIVCPHCDREFGASWQLDVHLKSRPRTCVARQRRSVTALVTAAERYIRALSMLGAVS